MKKNKQTKEQKLKKQLDSLNIIYVEKSEQLKEIAIKYDTLSQHVEETKSKISKILKNNRGYPNGMDDEYKYLKLNDIPEIIAELKGKVGGLERKEGELKPHINLMREDTLNKLWYLVRVAMKDETIIPKIDEKSGKFIDLFNSRFTDPLN